MLLLYRQIEHNPAINLLPVKRRKSTRYQHIPNDIIFTLIKATSQRDEKQTDLHRQTMDRDKLMILLLWCLGLRSLELRSIKKEDIKIIDQQKKTALLTVHGKGAKQRALLIMDTLFDQLTEYIKKFNDDQLIFPGKNNKVLHDTTINRRLNKYTTAKTHITAHSLRHSFATEMYYANVPLEAIKTMLGHENLRETSAYIHVSDIDIRQSLNLLHIGA
jgi:site-specific recombinase XerD